MEFIQFMEPWMIPIFIMVFVTLIVIVSSVTKIITTSMKEKNSSGNLSENKEFLNALREFKETMERRVSNLEKLAASGELKPRTKNSTTKRNNQSSIELELNENSEAEKSKEPSRLKNMLNQ